MNPREEVLAIIPARGGSKGIPRKNLRRLRGLPLVAHSIGHALAAKEITRVVVSTDDSEVVEVAAAFGAEVVRRPAEISGDYASSESALAHVLDYLGEREGYRPHLVVFLQATSPIRKAADLDHAIRKIREEDADSLFSASRLNWFAWRLERNAAAPINYDFRKRPMRQQAPVDVIETGSFYIFKPWVLSVGACRLGGRITTYETGFLDALQIDEPEDLALLERLMPCAKERWDLSRVKLLALDFDGVLTDNRVWVDQKGVEQVCCTRADSLGIRRVQSAGVEVVVISTETNGVVQERCRKLGIACIPGIDEKGPVLESLMRARGLDAAEVAYVGNDVNDLDCLALSGWPVAVGDAVDEVKNAARMVTQARGGSGAVREVCDRIVESKGVRNLEQPAAAGMF